MPNPDSFSLCPFLNVCFCPWPFFYFIHISAGSLHPEPEQICKEAALPVILSLSFLHATQILEESGFGHGLFPQADVLPAPPALIHSPEDLSHVSLSCP